MQTAHTIKTLISFVKYKDWEFHVEERADCFTLQIQFVDEDTVTGEKDKRQYCRKWFLSKYMTDNEIIRTAFMAVEKAEFHEMCEKFTFGGFTIANPHLDVLKLAEGRADYTNLDFREEQVKF